MNKKNLFVWSISLLALLGCSKPQNPVVESNINNDVLEDTFTYSIPIESALSKLQNYLDYADNIYTKSNDGASRKIANVSVININKPCTKAVSKELECDSLLYLVDFEGDNGYAVLAADRRIPSDIITVVDSGTMSEDDLYMAIEKSEKVIDSAYPLDGPGIITDKDGDYINPNTFTLYDPNMNESYVVNP